MLAQRGGFAGLVEEQRELLAVLGIEEDQALAVEAGEKRLGGPRGR